MPEDKFEAEVAKSVSWHAVPARVIGPQRAARLKFASRVSTLWFMGLSAIFLLPPAEWVLAACRT